VQFGRSYSARHRSYRRTLRKGHQPYDRDQSAKDFLARLEEEYLAPDAYHDIDTDYLAGRLDFHDVRKLA